MADNLTMVKGSVAPPLGAEEALILPKSREPMGERIVQFASRSAGILAFVAGLGVTVVWLIG